MKQKNPQMNVIFSIQVEPNRQRSRGALNEKKNTLKEAYTQADKDPDRIKTIEDWQVLAGDEEW